MINMLGNNEPIGATVPPFVDCFERNIGHVWVYLPMFSPPVLKTEVHCTNTYSPLTVL
jgi:hypothetical protein